MIGKCKQLRRVAVIGVWALVITACGLAPTSRIDPASYRLPAVSAGTQAVAESEFVAALGRARAVVVGEQHDRYEHHLNQLEIVRLMHRNFGDIAIGLEYFQQPYQSHLDAYIRGDIGVNEMLRRTEYYVRWRYDFRLNEPVLAYAREHGIPVVALNVPAEVTRRFQRVGADGLTAEERRWLPDEIDRSNLAYRERLEQLFTKHPIAEGGSIDRLVEGQLIWDEGMAQRAAEHLQGHPGRRMVVLAGSGHVEYGAGIPDRLARRLGAEDAVVSVLQARAPLPPTHADFVVVNDRRHILPQAGLLGVFIAANAPEATVMSLSEDGAARAAGIQAGDVITAIDGEPVTRFADLKASLWSKRPGDRVQVSVRRDPTGPQVLTVALR